MPNLTSKIAIPIILVGIFAIIIFVAISYQQLAPSAYIIISFLVIFVFFFGLAIGQNLSVIVKKILNNAEELSKGNLSSRVYLETKDELSQLATAFNKLAEELQASREQQALAEKSVDIKVRARTKEMEETIEALEQKVRNRTAELEKLMKAGNGQENENSLKL